tara:strand:+ start:318 stop:650 length:333 start_codon:yes stop_codon:yes gene_type:complete
MKVQIDVRNVVVLNNYSFKKITLSFKYVKEMTIDIATPVIDKISVRNLLDRSINKENTRIMKNNIPKINNEFFKRIKAYTGTIFSFQWSLILDEIMTRNTLFVLLTIKLT